MISRSENNLVKRNRRPGHTHPARDESRFDDTVTTGTPNCKFSEAKRLLRFAKCKIAVPSTDVNSFSSVFGKKIEAHVPVSLLLVVWCSAQPA
jgi:hypothetical protein